MNQEHAGEYALICGLTSRLSQRYQAQDCLNTLSLEHLSIHHTHDCVGIIAVEMPFLAKEHIPIATKDILSWIFDEPTFDQDTPVRS
jgi:hypothetical protein